MESCDLIEPLQQGQDDFLIDVGRTLDIEELSVLLEEFDSRPLLMLVEHIRTDVVIGNFLHVLPTAGSSQRQREA